MFKKKNAKRLAAHCSLLIFLCAGCYQKKVELVEKTPPSQERDEVLVKVEMQESKTEKKQKDAVEDVSAAGKQDLNAEMNNEKKEGSNVLLDEEGMPLDLSFAEISGRANPFIPPGTAMGVPTISSTPSAALPTYTNPSSAVPILAKDPIKGQLMPMQGQKTAVQPAVPPIPEWPGESPILSAGPPERLQSLLNLTYKGLMVNQKGKRVGVIELFVRDDVTGSEKQLSYIVTPGRYVTEYNLKVKELTSQYIVLTRGSQRIELPLVEAPKTLPYAVDKPSQFPQQSPYAQKAGSASQWSPATSGGTSQ